MTPIERPTGGLLCNMPVVIKGKKKRTLKRPFETLNDASKDVDLWPPLEPDRFAGLLLLESCGASFLCILENSFRLCGLQNYSYQCVAWGKGHICRLFVSNKMLAVEKGSSPDLAIEAAAKIAVKRLINYHYILKIKPNMSLDQLVARPTLPTQETNVSSVHSSSRSDKDSPFFRNKGTKVIKKSDRNLRKRYKRNSIQVGKRLASSACPRESNQKMKGNVICGIARMWPELRPRALLEGIPDGARPLGQSRTRWENELRKDMKELGA
uniref:Uncharacterized protein n=1 Tax=Timema douglasi TaxID=61478 RepID=A0A7R8Z689_TIMDO|nr:unnamed protein product [Timema douglasi]